MSQRPELQLVRPQGSPPVFETGSALPLVLSGVGYEVGGQILLHDINFSIGSDRVTVILGPNGAGKTLLLRICHGLIKPSCGLVKWQNPVAARHASAQTMMFQQPVLLRRNVRRNIEYAMKVCDVAKPSRGKRLDAALSISGLAAIADRQASKLSGGEKQRLALARCWAVKPQLLFLDEPTAHLDPSAARKIEAMVVEIQREDTCVVMVTHDLALARRLADRIVFMHRGCIVEHRDGAEFFASPASPAASAYINGELYW